MSLPLESNNKILSLRPEKLCRHGQRCITSIAMARRILSLWSESNFKFLSLRLEKSLSLWLDSQHFCRYGQNRIIFCRYGQKLFSRFGQNQTVFFCMSQNLIWEGMLAVHTLSQGYFREEYFCH